VENWVPSLTLTGTSSLLGLKHTAAVTEPPGDNVPWWIKTGSPSMVPSKVAIPVLPLLFPSKENSEAAKSMAPGIPPAGYSSTKEKDIGKGAGSAVLNSSRAPATSTKPRHKRGLTFGKQARNQSLPTACPRNCPQRRTETRKNQSSQTRTGQY
jgi:hypothetical protein